jgi:hypothetical protein
VLLINWVEWVNPYRALQEKRGTKWSIQGMMVTVTLWLHKAGQARSIDVTRKLISMVRKLPDNQNYCPRGV